MTNQEKLILKKKEESCSGDNGVELTAKTVAGFHEPGQYMMQIADNLEICND